MGRKKEDAPYSHVADERIRRVRGEIPAIDTLLRRIETASERIAHESFRLKATTHVRTLAIQLAEEYSRLSLATAQQESYEPPAEIRAFLLTGVNPETTEQYLQEIGALRREASLLQVARRPADRNPKKIPIALQPMGIIRSIHLPLGFNNKLDEEIMVFAYEYTVTRLGNKFETAWDVAIAVSSDILHRIPLTDVAQSPFIPPGK